MAERVFDQPAWVPAWNLLEFWSMTMVPDAQVPGFDALVEDVKLVRRRGITSLSQLELPALRAALVALGRAEAAGRAGPPEVETLLRDALSELEAGRFGDAPAILFGLLPGTRGYGPADLRSQAASVLDLSRSWFRNNYEPEIIDEMAQTILRLCHEHQLRLSALAMAQRLPTASRLAVAWMDRFEAYYAMWTPIYATAASIAAYRSTLLEEDRPWDQKPTPENPDGYTQELQAQGYGSQGLYFFAEYLTELRRFRTKFGGLWLLTSKAADTDIADASYLVHYRAPFSEREQSFLVRKYSEAAGDMHSFRLFEEHDPYFIRLHDTWQRFLATCPCTWDAGEPPERGHFHTHRIVKTIAEGCQPHQVISAANDYCVIIDNEWDLIADWYHIGEPRRTGVDGAALYEELRNQHRRKGTNVWPPWGTE